MMSSHPCHFLLIAFLLCAMSCASPQTPPSVVIILVDDLGAADVSFNARRLTPQAPPAILTPSLDTLADNGVVLTRYYTHALCGPSRSALLTGRTAPTLGNPFAMVGGGGIPPFMRTIAHAMLNRSHTTHFVGKWGVDYPPLSEELLKELATGKEKVGGPLAYRVYNGDPTQAGHGPRGRGFNSFFGLYGSGHNHFTKEIVYPGMVDWHRHNKTHHLDYPELDHEPDQYSTHLFTREAVSIIDGWSRERPGFLHLSYTAPHDPLQVPDDYVAPDTHCGRISNKRRRIFCGMVTAVDEGVGQITSLLKEKALLDDTIIVFSTDNGGAPGVGGFNYPYRGQKNTVFEGGLHNPGFIYGPKWLRGGEGTDYQEIFHIADWSPTLLGMVDHITDRDPAAGQVSLTDIDGVDHSSVLLRRTSPGPRDLPSSGGAKGLLLEFNAIFDHAAYLEGHWKLVLGNGGRDALFEEPVDEWYDSSHRSIYLAEEVVCDWVDFGLGPNYFAYGWILRWLLDLVYNVFVYGERPPTWLASTLAEAKIGDTVEITEERLPTVEWNRAGRVRLYHLQTDPYEEHNVALQHKDTVERLAKNMRSHILAQIERFGEPNEESDAPSPSPSPTKRLGHNLSIQKTFMTLLYPMVNAIAGFIIVAVVLLVVWVLYRCKVASRGDVTSAKKND